MPHMCARCKKVFEDGTDILNGCPACGGRKFEYIRERGTDTLITEAMGVRRPPRRMPRQDINEKDTKGHYEKEVPQIEELRVSKIKPKTASDDETPIESVRIAEPGRYELNLPTLFSRDELVMALKEGTYLIDLNSAFRRSKR